MRRLNVLFTRYQVSASWQFKWNYSAVLMSSVGLILSKLNSIFKLTHDTCQTVTVLVSLNRLLGSMESDLPQIIRDRPSPWIKHPTEWWRQSLTEISNKIPLVELKFHSLTDYGQTARMVNLPNCWSPPNTRQTLFLLPTGRNDRQMALQVAYQAL